MSNFSDQLRSPGNFRVTLGPVARPADALRYLSIRAFETLFSCRINSLPQNICLLGWRKDKQRWYCAPESLGVQQASHISQMFHGRSIGKLLGMLSTDVFPSLDLRSVWFPFCIYDGWRERNVYSAHYRWVNAPNMSASLEWRGAPGEIPVLSPSQHWLACFGAHKGDPSALVMPEAYYLTRNHYIDLFDEIDRQRVPWANKKSRGVLAATDQGESSNLFIPTGDPGTHPRRLFRQTVAEQNVDIDVYLGKNFSRGEQLGYRYIADVDGFVRTWDAWAWKMMSGSTVLSVDSPWASFFQDQFAPWTHYVPIANDSSDLAEKFAWCVDHDRECEAIAERARERAIEVYARSYVVNLLGGRLRQHLATPAPAGFESAVVAARADAAMK